MRELLKATGTDRFKFKGLYKRVLMFLNVRVPLSSPEDYLNKRLVPLLGIRDEDAARAKEIIAKLREMGHTCGKNPSAVAAAALYIASLSSREPMRLSKLARVAGVTPITIKNNAKFLMRVLGIVV